MIISILGYKLASQPSMDQPGGTSPSEMNGGQSPFGDQNSEDSTVESSDNQTSNEGV